MALSGNTREFSLADLIVVKAQDPRSHRLTLSGPAGDGLLLIESGRIVHASYGELPPLDAAHVLVTEQNVDFEVEADAEIAGHTLDLSAQELLMEAMRRLDEGILRRPRQASIELASSGARRKPPRPRSHEAKKSPEAEALRRATGRVLFADPEAVQAYERSKAPKVIALILGMALLVAGTLFGWRSGWFAGQEHRDSVEVMDLAGPRDVIPMLLSGAPGIAPDHDATFLPTVLCRVLVDSRGLVREALVYQHRSGLDPFEKVALETVRNYRFTPAQREGVPVPVWVVWPVDFIRAARVGEPRPVDAKYFKDQRPGDSLPILVAGDSPEAPLPEGGLRPRIAFRLLVDETGSVVEAEVVAPSPALELYERVALDTVRGYRFTPGEREGVQVPAWLDWTVEFR